MNIEKTYIYANSQIIAQHDGGYSAPRYFYLHDRLGSVRQVIDSDAVVVKMFTFEPFGETIESGGSFDNPFRFTGQYLDSETGHYYLRARQYSPYLSRFITRDLIDGDFEEPITLHKYLYCGNNPINRTDPTGLWRRVGSWHAGYHNTEETQKIITEATELMGQWWKLGPLATFGPIDAPYDFEGSGATFQLDKTFMYDSEFGNLLAGYTSYYNYVEFGNLGVRFFGHLYEMGDTTNEYFFDDPGSKYFISGGILRARGDRIVEGKRKGLLLDFVMAKYDLFHGYERIASNDPLGDEYWQEIENLVSLWNYCRE